MQYLKSKEKNRYRCLEQKSNNYVYCGGWKSNNYREINKGGKAKNLD